MGLGMVQGDMRVRRVRRRRIKQCQASGLQRVAGEGSSVGMQRQLLVAREQVWMLLVISIAQSVVSSPFHCGDCP